MIAAAGEVDLSDDAVADPAEADGPSLELGRERAAGPLLLDGPSGSVHGALLMRIHANSRVQDTEAGSAG